MPRKSAASEPAIFRLDDFRPVGFDDPDEREIEIRNDVVLHVTLAHLTTRQARKIPTGNRTPLEQSFRAAAQYVLDWDAQVINPQTGETIDVPAPGHPDAPAFVRQYIGDDAEPWELLEYLFDDVTGSRIVMWLTNPAGMQLVSERGKKSSTPSKHGATPPDGSDTDTT